MDDLELKRAKADVSFRKRMLAAGASEAEIEEIIRQQHGTTQPSR